MKIATIHDAKTNLSKYLAAVRRGEKVYVGSFGKPEFEIVATKKSKNGKKRTFDALHNKITVSDDAFSKQTDSEIAKLLYGKDG